MTYEIKYRREDEMKDSGIEWLGKIPKEWVKADLIKTLKTKITDGPHETPQYIDEGIPFISVDSINDKEYVDLDVVRKFISYEQYKEYNKKTRLQINDILFTKSATIGKVAIVDSRTFMTWSPLAIIKANDLVINYKLLYNILKSSRYIDYIKSLSNLNTQLNIGMGVLEKSIITYSYDLLEQQKIANFLDLKTSEFDSIISKKELLIEKLEEAKKSLISEVVTGKVKIVDGELVEREPDEMKDSGVQWLGMIPKDWNLMKIKDVTKIFRGRFNHRPRNDFKLYENGTYPFIQTGDVAKANKYLVKYTQTLNKVGAKVSIKFPIGTLIMTIAANIGDLAIAKIGAFYPDSIVGFYPKIRELNSEYLYLLFSSMKEEFLRNSIVNTQANLNIERVGNIKITIGSKTEIDLVVKYLNAKMKDLNSIITKTKHQIQKLKQAKQSLISECVTGKIDLRDWEIQ